MKRNVSLMLAGALAVGLIAAGCGDDGNDDASSGTGTEASEALTTEEYLAEGNAICEQGNAELEQAGEPTSEAEFDAFVTDTLVPNVQGQIDQLRELGIPEGDEDTVNGILDDAEAVLADLEADPASIQGNTDPFAAVNEDLTAYGLTTCSGG